MAAPSPAETAFLTWLTTHGTTLSSSIALTTFPSMGRGLVALTDIQPDTLLFSLPRALLLTTSTSALPSLLPADEWANLGGWTPLILILMYERLRPASVPSTTPDWSAYFDLLPAAGSFDSLMFWNEDELSWLKGSLVLSKIGKEEAEEEFAATVVSVVERFPDVFGPKEAYSLELFHYMGSLILSRSFHVESAEEEESDEEDEEEEESEDVGDVAMVPMADLLNAKSGCDNARLFYAPTHLSMMSTSFIPAGTQIFNTYADPPNSDLLRRYGHVDEVNEADLVEIGLESIVDLVGAGVGMDEEEREARAEWLLEIGVDDTFPLDASLSLPDELIATIRTFLLTPPELAKLAEKERPPKPLLDPISTSYLLQILRKRESEYATSIEEDEVLLAANGVGRRERMAVIVRVGEKRILRNVREKVEREAATGGKGEIKGEKKRGREGENEGRKKVKVLK